MICANKRNPCLKNSLDTNGNENRLETTDVRRGMEKRKSFTLDRCQPRAGVRLSYVKLGNCVIIGENSRIFLQGLNSGKISTVREQQQRLPCGLGAFRTIRPMLLSMHVMTVGRQRCQALMVTIGVFLANPRTVCFAHGSHCCVGGEQRHSKNNRRQSTIRHNFYDTPGGISTQVNRRSRRRRSHVVVQIADLAAVEPQAPGLAELIVGTEQFGPAEPFFPGLCCIYRGNGHSQRMALRGLSERNRI
jgi:hypothetical protein